MAADDPNTLDTAANEKRDLAVAWGLKVLSWQDCERVAPDGYGIEPFGFRDGISQPGIRGFNPVQVPVQDKRLEAKGQLGTPIIAAGEFVLGYPGEGGSYPDVRRSRLPEWMRDGSFQVFLRLRQDVGGWNKNMDELAPLSAPESAAATAIGRGLDGKPLAAPEQRGDSNDFTFENDERGEQTPRFAHIRKMNPRNGTFDDRTHRLLRRGIPFATALHVEPLLPGADDKVEHGLAFNSFMASIENQFEFLLRNWASNSESLPPRAKDGPDPLVGASKDPSKDPGVRRREGKKSVPIPFGRFVWTSGAVYAFAPSLPTLRSLAGLQGA